MKEEKETKKDQGMRVAIVHDYLREYGGAERVIEELHRLFPEAPVYVGFVDFKAMGERGAKRFAEWDIRTTWLQRVPGIKKFYSPLRIWAAKAFEGLDLSEYDLVISSSNAYFAKAVAVPNGEHFCYCHTPARSLYGYETQSGRSRNKLMKIASDFLNHFLRIKDFEVAQKVDVFLANSEIVRERIQKFYRRDAAVVYPPVKLADWAKRFQVGGEDGGEAEIEVEKKIKEPYFLYVNRLNYAKHPELAVETAQKMNLNLKIIGNGPMKEELLEMIAAGKNGNSSKVEFLENIDDEKLAKSYAGASGLFYPVADEDFGMIPIEAMAFGTPVIAHRSGGPTETIEEGVSGVFFDEMKVESMMEAVKKFQKKKWDREKIAKTTQKYTAASFDRRLKKIIDEYCQNGRKKRLE